MNEDSYYRILIADNNSEEIEAIREIISSGFPASVDTTLSSKEAIMQIDYHVYDLIIMNFDVNERSDIKLKEYISSSFLNSNSNIIFITDNDDPQTSLPEKVKRLESFITRPIKRNELFQLLQLHFLLIKKEQEFHVQWKEEKKKRELLENEIEKSRKDFGNIVERSSNGILIVDQEGMIQFVNEAGEKVFLRQKDELVGHQFGVLLGFDKRTEIDIVRSDGEVGVGEITTVDTEWDGKPAKLVIINDITKHKKLQESLEIAMQKAQESDRLKTAFLANMSHEIRTPLNGILGFSQLLDNNIDAERKHFYVSSIISCGNYLLDIISDIIDISQIESGQMVINESEFNLIELINEVYEMYRINAKVLAKNLELGLEYPHAESIMVHSDPSRLKQILINLLNNAVKFTDKGKVSYGFEIKDARIQFFVRDTGPGIAKSDFEIIFERFRQLEAPKNKLNEGNGLGLSICMALVHLLGGEIWLESELNVGTTFYFTIPVLLTDMPLSDTTFSKTSKVKAGFRNKKILIVEDEESNFYFMQAVIKDLDTTIFWAKDGQEAVEIAMKEDVDLILMDMKLPVKSGYDAVKEIRKQKPTIPIIAQTAYALSNDKEKVLAAGCNDYIAKPIKVDELMYKMNSFLN
ncbi:MAG TPA: response regulator [Bacteroidales bacterium]